MNEFNVWKIRSEILSKANGHPIKILDKKWNTIKNILAIVGVLCLLLSAGVLVYAYNSENFEISKTDFTIKIIYNLDFSPELKSYIDNTINQTLKR
jgi:hypothetical protein